MSLKRLVIIVSLGSFLLFALPYGHSYADYGGKRLEIISPENLETRQGAPLDIHSPDTVSPPAETGATGNAAASYRLGSGDKIKITVYGEPSLSGTYLVNEEGYISFPLVNEVKVKDDTIIEARRSLQAKLSDGFLIDPKIAIEVEAFRPIYIMGEVRNPGSYDFRTDMSVRNAIAIAGGFTYRANQKKIDVTRQLENDENVHIVLGKDDRIHPGDVILVKERFF